MAAVESGARRSPGPEGWLDGRVGNYASDELMKSKDSIKGDEVFF